MLTAVSWYSQLTTTQPSICLLAYLLEYVLCECVYNHYGNGMLIMCECVCVMLFGLLTLGWSDTFCVMLMRCEWKSIGSDRQQHTLADAWTSAQIDRTTLLIYHVDNSVNSHIRKKGYETSRKSRDAFKVIASVLTVREREGFFHIVFAISSYTIANAVTHLHGELLFAHIFILSFSTSLFGWYVR